MSVYNGAEALPRTLHSVLAQEGVDFEFIVINDGSTDASGRILDEWAARDARLRVIHQENTGLTRALIRGCAEARGEFIARQDCGDVSLPGRLARQVDFLRRSSHVVMLAAGARFVGPEAEPLHEILLEGRQLHDGLSRLELSQLKGPPHHGATMFRRSIYLAAGGYRQPFVVAQDIDLWLRLSEHGQCYGLAEVLYEAAVESGSISSRRRAEQFQLGALAIACAQARRMGGNESELLSAFRLQPSSLQAKGPPDAKERARFFYFLGASLARRDPQAARRYFSRAWQENPWHVKALLRRLIGV